jgi:hypothetical protein
MLFMLVYVHLVAFHKKNKMIISKNWIFGVFTIIDQIHLGFPFNERSDKKNKINFSKPYPSSVRKKIKYLFLKVRGLQMGTLKYGQKWKYLLYLGSLLKIDTKTSNPFGNNIY